ncbi:MAG TPA: PAS-domain containing protein, partial [Rhodopila sp.]|nr:PAS-domain containing protein [Rhodopila sp.]
MADSIIRPRHMNIARALRTADGTFAGVISTGLPVAVVLDAFGQLALGTQGFAALVGTDDGHLRAALGSAIAGTPSLGSDISIADTPMFRTMRRSWAVPWTGTSPVDAVRRIHVFHAIPGYDLAVVVAMQDQEAMAPAIRWRRQALLLAASLTVLLFSLAALLAAGAHRARRRDARIAADRAALAASGAELEAARAEAAAKAERLEATLGGMIDGVSMIDADLRLVEWNARFPEIAGIPPEILRVGLPMEELLRAQVATGQFGRLADGEAEVQRRMARLRVAPYGVTQR